MRPKKELDSSRAYRLRGAFGFFLLIPATLFTLFSDPLVKEGTWSSILLDGVAWVLFWAGVAFRIWATLYVGSRKLTTLVDEGPYSVCRNPLYVGTFLMVASTAVFLKSLLLTAAVLMLMTAYTLATVPAEERALLNQHGESYAAYRKRVPRYLPCLRLFSTGSEIEVKANGVRLEAKRLALYVWMPFAAEIIGHLRVQPWWPHWFRFVL